MSRLLAYSPSVAAAIYSSGTFIVRELPRHSGSLPVSLAVLLTFPLFAAGCVGVQLGLFRRYARRHPLSKRVMTEVASPYDPAECLHLACGVLKNRRASLQRKDVSTWWFELPMGAWCWGARARVSARPSGESGSLVQFECLSDIPDWRSEQRNLALARDVLAVLAPMDKRTPSAEPLDHEREPHAGGPG